MDNIKLSFLTQEQVWEKNKLEIFKKHETKAALSDFSIILGNCSLYDHSSEGNNLKYRTGCYWTKTSGDRGNIRIVHSTGSNYNKSCQEREISARLTLTFSNNFSIPTNIIHGSDGIDEFEYGEYPQVIADKQLVPYLNANFYLKTLTKTGKEYTIDSRKYNEYNKEFSPIKLTEYEYNGEKYVRVKVNSHIYGNNVTLSNGLYYKNNDYVWIKVEPIKWIKEPEKNLFVSKNCLFSGVRFNKYDETYDDNKFEETEINNFLQNYIAKEIIPSKVPKTIKNEKLTINNFIFVDKDGNKKKKRIVVKVKNKN